MQSTLLVSASLLSASHAYAQTTPAPAASEVLETVVITARKKTEVLQEVPMSAAVVGGPAIADQGIGNLQDLARTVPAVQIAQGSISNRQYVRGIGSGDNPAFEQSVGIFIDDIYHGRSRTSEGGLFDLERVEVLKGPQTTYFGANAIAGALNMVTRDPGNNPAANVRGLYTPEFDGYQVEAGVDVPIVDTLAARFAGQVSGGDGWIDDRALDDNVPKTDNSAFRGTLLWKPTDAFSARLKAQHGLFKTKGGLALGREDCPQAAAFNGPSGFCALIIAAGAEPYSGLFDRNTTAGQSVRLETDDYVGTLEYDAGRFVLTSVTGYSSFKFKLNQDLDLSPLNLLHFQQPEKYQQVSQELRITSDDSGPIEYLAGLYYQDSKLDPSQTFIYGYLSPRVTGNPTYAALVPYLPLAVDNQYEENATVKSVFGALTWKPIDGLQVTGALRYSEVDKDFERDIFVSTGSFVFDNSVPVPASVSALANSFAAANGLGVVGHTELERSDDHLSRSLSVQYELNRDLMVYARYDHGFKAGGFNGIDQNSAAGLLAFEPETVNAYEVGMKSMLLDDRATFNVALFRSKFNELQLSGIVPSTTGTFTNRVQNAGGAVSQGVEVEFEVRILDALRTNLSAAYLDAHYTSYPNATPTALQAVNGQRFQDLSGDTTPLAPKWSANWTVDYSVPLPSDLTLRFTNTLFYKSRVFLNPNNDPNVVQGSYAREDLTIALESGSGWEVSVIGKNLTDRTIKTFGAALPGSLGSYTYMTEPPRNVSLQMKYDF